MAKPENDRKAVSIDHIEMGSLTMSIIGTSPYISNRFSEKARQELLLPTGRRNSAELEVTMKHDPIAEFRSSTCVNRDEDAPTLFHIPTNCLHKALGQAAIDIPGTAKSPILRLTTITTPTVHLYGVPKLCCSMVRQAGINRTPDVRTRAWFPEWACEITIKYVKGLITERSIVNLMVAAGNIVGIGDWRSEKGGSYGKFAVVSDETAKDFERILRTQARAAQQKAFDHPQFYDEQSEELLAWFEDEVTRREKQSKVESLKPRKPKIIAAE